MMLHFLSLCIEIKSFFVCYFIIIKISIMSSDKIINSICGGCNKAISSINDDNYILSPCDHLIHKKCYKKIEKKKSRKCPLCKTDIKLYYSKEILKTLFTQTKKYEYYQKYVDIISMDNFDDYSNTNYIKTLAKSFDIIKLVSNIPLLKNISQTENLCKQLFSTSKIKIIINGNYNALLKDKSPKVYIANHTSYFDGVVMFYLFKCSFLASSFINESIIGKQISSALPLLIINRGDKSNTVDRMKEYVKNNGSICLFPEGMITHPDTIINFRTGAFNIGYPIYPIVMKYDPVIYDDSVNTFLVKLFSQDEIKITVNILPKEYPSFTPEKIEKIRKKMAKVGNMALSRVSNRDIKDK
jgi:1-acyl-sn-glycerol-3-phosphate acyltransferase